MARISRISIQRAERKKHSSSISPHDLVLRPMISGQVKVRYPCTHPGCQVTVSRKADVKRHMRTHDPSTWIPCRFRVAGCYYRDPQRSNVKNHERIHTGTRLKCPDGCGEECTDSARMHRHRVDVHGYIPSLHDKPQEGSSACPVNPRRRSRKVSHARYERTNRRNAIFSTRRRRIRQEDGVNRTDVSQVSSNLRLGLRRTDESDLAVTSRSRSITNAPGTSVLNPHLSSGGDMGSNVPGFSKPCSPVPQRQLSANEHTLMHKSQGQYHYPSPEWSNNPEQHPTIETEGRVSWSAVPPSLSWDSTSGAGLNSSSYTSTTTHSPLQWERHMPDEVYSMEGSLRIQNNAYTLRDLSENATSEFPTPSVRDLSFAVDHRHVQCLDRPMSSPELSSSFREPGSPSISYTRRPTDSPCLRGGDLLHHDAEPLQTHDYAVGFLPSLTRMIPTPPPLNYGDGGYNSTRPLPGPLHHTAEYHPPPLHVPDERRLDWDPRVASPPALLDHSAHMSSANRTADTSRRRSTISRPESEEERSMPPRFRWKSGLQPVFDWSVSKDPCAGRSSAKV